MPTSPYVKRLQKETGKEIEELEKHWSKAKKITEDTFGVEEDEFTDREFEYAKESVYRMLGLDERFSIAEFIKSDMSAKEFIEQAVQTSGDFSTGEGGYSGKKKPYKDNPDDPSKAMDFDEFEKEDHNSEDEGTVRKFKQDGTGPHGQGTGPGEGKADGSGRKPGSKMSYEEEAIFSGHYTEEGIEPEEESIQENIEEEDEDYKEMLNDEALPNN